MVEIYTAKVWGLKNGLLCFVDIVRCTEVEFNQKKFDSLACSLSVLCSQYCRIIGANALQ